MGSPPRVRGKLNRVRIASCRLRITPARAGKTSRHLTRRAFRTDHPRACGENAFPTLIPGVNTGSPPRVRGKRCLCAEYALSLGITPARAGKTRRCWTGWKTAEDHPRACGENFNPVSSPSPYPGSPPRVRGKPFVTSRDERRRGITPARAGKTLTSSCFASPWRDHPRACGENAPHARGTFHAGGSPPRVRGKLFSRSKMIPFQRITPARAGKTWDMCVGLPITRDHPRACGENYAHTTLPEYVLGSPPRVRGKLWCIAGRTGFQRITPARAGKTPQLSRRSPLSEDHPRACGENNTAQFTFDG